MLGRGAGWPPFLILGQAAEGFVEQGEEAVGVQGVEQAGVGGKGEAGPAVDEGLAAAWAMGAVDGDVDGAVGEGVWGEEPGDGAGIVLGAAGLGEAFCRRDGGEDGGGGGAAGAGALGQGGEAGWGAEGLGGEVQRGEGDGAGAGKDDGQRLGV